MPRSSEREGDTVRTGALRAAAQRPQHRSLPWRQEKLPYNDCVTYTYAGNMGDGEWRVGEEVRMRKGRNMVQGWDPEGGLACPHLVSRILGRLHEKTKVSQRHFSREPSIAMSVFWSHSDRTGSELLSVTQASHTGRLGLDETQGRAGSSSPGGLAA